MSTPSATAEQAAPIEIFRAGRHRAMTGEELAFSAADLAAAVAAYDPALHEAPIVVGHPSTDAPAYGWVTGLALQGETLTAVPGQVEPAFAAMVRDGRFKKISAAFFRPDAPGNPRPGTWYLRHVGFLGAQPPSVRGLKAPAFAAGEAGVVTFAAAGAPAWAPGWTLGRIASLLRGLREWMLEQSDRETVDRVLPAWELDSLHEEGVRAELDARGQAAPAFSQPNTTEERAVTTTIKPAEPSEQERQLAAEREQLAAERAAFAEQRRTAEAAETETLLTRLVTEGRLPSGLKAQAAAFAAKLEASETVAFAEGQPAQTPLQAFRALLAALPPMVAFGELAPSIPGGEAPGGLGATAAFAMPAGQHGLAVDPAGLELDRRARAYQQAHPNTDYLTAVRAVGGN